MRSALVSCLFVFQEKKKKGAGYACSVPQGRQGKAGVKLLPGQIQDTSVHVQKLQLMNLDL